MKSALKIIKLVVVTFFLLSTITSCEKHDFIDEMSITGEVGPQAIWELGSSSVAAGNSVDFTLQYYSTVSEISHSEVWYSVTEEISKKVTCPWVSTFTYSIVSNTSQLKRISEKVVTFPNTMAVWSDSLSANVLKKSFPVTGTLSSFSWKQPEQFNMKDSLSVNNYFGNNFMQHFKDSLYDKMKYADFKKMILGLALDEKLKQSYGGKSFKELTDSTFDKNSNSYVYHFPKLEDGSTPVPNSITELYKKEIPFAKLIQTPSGYDIEYERKYEIDALMRVYDVRGVYGNTVLKNVAIN